MNVWSHGCPRFDEKSYPWFIRVFTYTIEVERNVQFTERSGRSTRIAHNVEVKSPSAETWISHFFRSCKLTAFSSKPQPMTCQLGDMKKYGFFRKFMIFIKKTGLVKSGGGWKLLLSPKKTQWSPKKLQGVAVILPENAEKILYLWKFFVFSKISKICAKRNENGYFFAIFY